MVGEQARAKLAALVRFRLGDGKQWNEWRDGLNILPARRTVGSMTYSARKQSKA